VGFRDSASGKVYNIEGTFPLCDPWWSATVFLSGGSKKRSVGCQSFKRRSDELMTKEKVVWLFVTASVHKRDDHSSMDATYAFYQALE